MKKPRYKRILLKLSGEALSGKQGFGIDFNITRAVATDLALIAKSGIELGVVIGGGNIFRGRNIPKDSIDRATADYMGMTATIMNAIALQAEIEQCGAHCRVLTAISMKEVAEDYIRRQAKSHLKDGKIVIFAAGTGNPYFTTDTAAALRALEVGAEVLLKATTSVDGVYTSDPNTKGKKKPKKLQQITFHGALTKRIKVMDSTAFSLCMDNKLPIIIFKYKPGALAKIVAGETIGTIVK
ncbi:UMP kinase [bacterium CG10_46_32]|nr:MAG: UMP kinase [bacterium CG10_46_32]PIR55729.1 MAG: UMP kinase [Parcubacteria group bacterium CG10_big_fil_rev_8_21_14_0_10_46_32]